MKSPPATVEMRTTALLAPGKLRASQSVGVEFIAFA